MGDDTKGTESFDPIIEVLEPHLSIPGAEAHFNIAVGPKCKQSFGVVSTRLRVEFWVAGHVSATLTPRIHQAPLIMHTKRTHRLQNFAVGLNIRLPWSNFSTGFGVRLDIIRSDNRIAAYERKPVCLERLHVPLFSRLIPVHKT